MEGLVVFIMQMGGVKRKVFTFIKLLLQVYINSVILPVIQFGVGTYRRSVGMAVQVKGSMVMF